MARFKGTPVSETEAQGEARQPRFKGKPVTGTPFAAGPVKKMSDEQRRDIQPSTNVYDEGGRQIFKDGIVENVAAGANEMIYDTVGGFADRAQNVINWGIAGLNAVTGQQDLTINMLREDPIGGSKWLSDVFEQAGVNDPDKVIATDMAQRLARAGGQGVGAAIAPEGVLALLSKAGIVGEKAMKVAGTLFGNGKSIGGTARNAFAGGTAGIGAQAGMEMAPEALDPLAATAGGLAGGGVGAVVTETPTIMRAAGKVASDYLAPITQSGRERLVGTQLREGATSPGGVVDTIQTQPTELVEGSMPTTGQMTGDMGILAMERAAATKDPAAFNQRRADQNAARMNAFEGMQANGTPEQVAAAVRTHLADIDRMTQDSVDIATDAARSRVEILGEGRSPDIAGADLRGGLETSRAAAKDAERALWTAVDPDGSLALPADKTMVQANAIPLGMSKAAKPMSGEEAAIFEAAGQLGSISRFSDITALQSRIKTAMREEKIANGESSAYARLSRLNAAVQSDLETAIVQKVTKEQQAVAAGEMSFEQTIAANIQKWQDDWRARKTQAAVGLDNSGVSVSGARGGAPGTGSVSGAASAGGQGLRSAPSTSGLPGDDLAPNFDEAALDRLNAARAATRQRVETFDNPTLSPMRRRPSTTAPYQMPDSAVSGRLFFAGPKSFDAIQTYRNAVGDEVAMPILQDYAIDRLRRAALREDGTLDPGKVAAFRRSHSDALRAMPELDAALADTATASVAMMDAAQAQRAALADAQRGSIGKLMGLDNPDDVTSTVGALFGRQDAVKEMQRLRAAIGNNAEAQQGLRRAVVDNMLDRFVSSTESATSGLGTIKGEQLQAFIGQNKATLRAAGFTDDEIRLWDNLAQDIQRFNRSQSAVRIPGQSNTAQDVLAANAGDSGTVSTLKLILASAASGSGATAAFGPLLGLPIALGTGVTMALRQLGLRKMDVLLRDALLDPSLAHALMLKAKPARAKDALMNFMQVYRRAILAGAASSEDEAHSKRISTAPFEMGPARRPGEPVADALMSEVTSGPAKGNRAVLSALLSREKKAPRLSSGQSAVLKALQQRAA